jgi:hypothetical protein
VVAVEMIYFESDYLVVSWDTEIQAVISTWEGYTGGSDKIQIGHSKILELIRQQKAGKWLNDLRHLKVVDKADQEWISTELPPLLLAAAIRITAIVIPESPTAQLSNQNIMKHLKEGEITRGIFTSLEEARDWLR